jgi:L-seryl-tRNA(Ser) seleniumtransferase
LLGRKDLVKAAWVHSAPHHGYARAMKVGREEVVGMVTAVESWVKRDHEAEWKEWVARGEHIAGRVGKIPGVTATVRRDAGEGRSNRSPGVTLRWDSAKLGITGPEVTDILYNTEPRIALGGGGGARVQDAPGDTGISLGLSMMAPGDEKIVAERVFAVLSAKRTPKPVEPPRPAVADLSGQWQFEIQYTASKTTHTLHLQQKGNQLEGTHRGNFLARDIAGTISGDAVSLMSNVTERHGDALRYRFTGTLAGDTMSGTVDMGEYLTATWVGRRYVSGRT